MCVEAIASFAPGAITASDDSPTTATPAPQKKASAARLRRELSRTLSRTVRVVLQNALFLEAKRWLWFNPWDPITVAQIA